MEGFENLNIKFNLDNMSMSSVLQMLELDLPMTFPKGNYSIEEYLRVSNEYTEDKKWFSTTQEVAIICTFAIVSICGLIGNGLVIYIISQKGRRQSSRNWFILNLAASDILTCVVCKPLTVVRLVLKNWILGETLCKMVPSLQAVYVLVSTFTLVALAVDRYLSIIYNSHRSRYKSWVSLCIAFIWTSAIGISTPLAVVHEIKQVQGFNGKILYSLCLERWKSESAVASYTASLLLLQYLSPLVAIVVLHLLIGRFLRSRFRNRSEDEPNARRKKARHRKNMLLLSSMAISFGVAWFPLHLVNAWATINYSFFRGINFPLLHALCMVIAFSSVCVNPVIYGLLNTNFRRDLIKICRAQAPRLSVYTDFTRRSSHNVEQLGLISVSPNEQANSCSNLSRLRASTITTL